MRKWQVERRKRTRHLIELGGLVVKAGLVTSTGDDRAAIYGALLWMADTLKSDQGEHARALWAEGEAGVRGGHGNQRDKIAHAQKRRVIARRPLDVSPSELIVASENAILDVAHWRARALIPRSPRLQERAKFRKRRQHELGVQLLRLLPRSAPFCRTSSVRRQRHPAAVRSTCPELQVRLPISWDS